jgi:glycosyltransferase involved in cell wall biosynthesis
MYDTQSVMQRKNPEAVVEAYLRAFGDGRDDTFLVLKVNTAGERELAPLRRRIEGRPDVHLVTDVLSRSDMDSLMAACDIFVSLHRSEGFGLPIAEAMAQGKAVIATAWSGNMDFMSEHTAACVSYELVTLERAHGPYPAGARWAEPDHDDAVEWMRRLRDDEALRAKLGAAAARSIAESSSAHVVGSTISHLLAQRGRS